MALCTEPLNRPNKNESMSCILEGEVYPPFTEQTWTDNSGSSYHLDNNDSGIYDVTIVNDIIGMIDKKTSVRTTKMGQKRYVVKQVSGEESIREFYHVKYSQDVAHMLLSITW